LYAKHLAVRREAPQIVVGDFHMNGMNAVNFED
jgi:hypothetical protein